jgi:hypothetical protein
LPTSPNRTSKRRKKNRPETATRPVSKPEAKADSAKDLKPSADTDESVLRFARKYRDELDSDSESSESEEGERLLSSEPPSRPRPVEIAPEPEPQADRVRPPEPVKTPVAEAARDAAPELPEPREPATGLPPAPAEEAPLTLIAEQAGEPGHAESEQVPEVPEPVAMPPSFEASPVSGHEADAPESVPPPDQATDSAQENMFAPGIEPPEQPDLSAPPLEELPEPLAAVPEQPAPPEPDFAAGPAEAADRIEAEPPGTVPSAELVEQTIFEDEPIPVEITATKPAYESAEAIYEPAELDPKPAEPLEFAGQGLEEPFEAAAADEDTAADIDIFRDEVAARPLEEALEDLEELAPALTEAAAAENPAEAEPAAELMELMEADSNEAEPAGADMASKEEIRDALRAVVELLQSAEAEAPIKAGVPAETVPAETPAVEAAATAETATTPEATTSEELPDTELTLRLLALLRAIGYDNPRQTLQDFIDRRGLESLLQKLRKIDDLAGLESKPAPSTVPEEAVEFEPGQLVSIRLIRPALAV